MWLMIIVLLYLPTTGFLEGQHCNTYMRDCITCNQWNDTVCSECRDTFTRCTLTNNRSWLGCCSGKCVDAHTDSFANNICDDCIDSYYGDNCDRHCKLNCMRCNKHSGECEECAPGFYGNSCNQKCPTNCKKYLCNRLTGRCLLCNNGQYGLYCNISCPNTCKDYICNQAYGQCIYGCHNNKTYGLQCDTQCPDTCKDMKCTNNGMCLACPDGFFGLNCTKRCSKHCFNSTCNQLDGICTFDCIANCHGDYCVQCIKGRYGENCEKDCSFHVKMQNVKGVRVNVYLVV